MLLAQSLRGRSRAGIGLAIAVAAGAIIMVANLFAGLLFLGLALLGLALALAAPARALPRGPARARVARAAQLTVYTPEGAELPALMVPVEAVEGYQMVLTSAGYRLVNRDGQIVYALK